MDYGSPPEAVQDGGCRRRLREVWFWRSLCVKEFRIQHCGAESFYAKRIYGHATHPKETESVGVVV